MSYTNSYRAPPLPTPSYGPTPYDVNFPFPLPAAKLCSARIRLVPFTPSKHAQPFHDGSKDHPDLFRYIPVHLHSLEHILILTEMMRSDPTMLLFAIEDLELDEKPIAGIIGLVHTSSSNLSTEIGPVIVLPTYQRTHVSTHAIGIVLRYCLDLPSQNGLGFRRVQWTANPANEKSVKVAERMGLKREGTLRWTWVLPEGKEGMKRGEEEKKGRDSVLLAICWDDWEEGVEKLVISLMERR
jgi:RimJ/RimL family protein N-acetyltransferase